MPDLRELYQEVILDHSKRPRNFHALEDANRSAEGYNPLCGDHFKVFLRLENEAIRDVSFEGDGCALSKASASMMTAALKGKSTAEAEQLFQRFHEMVTGKPLNGNREQMEKLAVFAGVSEFPVRVKCVSLAWHALHAALVGNDTTVSTE